MKQTADLGYYFQKGGHGHTHTHKQQCLTEVN